MRLSVLFEEFFVEVSHEIDRQKMLIPPFEIEFVFVYVLDYKGRSTLDSKYNLKLTLDGVYNIKLKLFFRQNESSSALCS